MLSNESTLFQSCVREAQGATAFVPEAMKRTDSSSTTRTFLIFGGKCVFVLQEIDLKASCFMYIWSFGVAYVHNEAYHKVKIGW